jgi:hypothetical protein
VAGSQVKGGGMIAVPEPGATEIHMVTFNTAEGSSVASNATHAERQFLSWLKSDDFAQWRSRVTGISISINYSPCKLCAGDLKDVQGLVRQSSVATRTLEWSKPYVDKKRKGEDNLSTTTGSLQSLGEVWTVKPATVGPEDAEKPDDLRLAVAPVIRRRG